MRRGAELLGRGHVLEAVDEDVGVGVAPREGAVLEPRDVQGHVADLTCGVEGGVVSGGVGEKGGRGKGSGTNNWGGEEHHTPKRNSMHACVCLPALHH